MARPARNVTRIISAADQHRAWLELVDTEGPFLAIPPLKRVWPQGMPNLSDEHKATLVDVRKVFESAWESLDRTPDREATLDAYRIARDKWVETVLRDVAGWAESLSWGEVPGIQAQSPNRVITVTAQAALEGVDGVGALVHLVDPVDSLRQTPGDLWAATPVDRMEALLRENRVEIGIVTDGRWWGLVCAREGKMAASGIVDALTWIEEPRTRDAFLTLIGRQHIIGGDPVERLPVLFEDSIAAAEEITEALGAQVRRAVELLIQSFAESAADAKRRGLPDPLPARTHDTYEAAVTVMMRTVFLLFAEERALLPSGELFEQGYGISRELDRLVGRETEESEEALDSTSLTWHRLLATSQALYSGASFESLRMPAYGGSLFDPTRFPFLTATNEQGTLAVTVSDRVMLHVLRSVQLAILKGGEARQISFRDVDVEQIGYIYEGLLGYTCATVGETYLGLLGSTGIEPEVPLAKLEELSEANADRKKFASVLTAWLADDQPSAKPPSLAAIAKAMTADVDPSVVSALTQSVGDDSSLRERVRPLLGLVRLDLRKRPFVVLTGGLLVKETPSRKNAGAHYTPKSLAEEVVLHALQPLCYSPGPHETADESEWRLRSSDDLLDLKVADIACGSGAFLVAAARYLADRVVEAWIVEDPSNSRRKDLHVRAIRQAVANCLYGADINDMAVEMCKLSLWLVSLDRDLPFSFVDDKVFLGNSLLGVTNLDQLRKLRIDPSRAPAGQMFDIFDVDIDGVIRKAVDLRQRLATEIDENDPTRNSSAKRRQLAQLRQVTADLRKISDGVIAAGLPVGGIPGKALDEAYENLRVAIKAAHPQEGELDSTFLDSIIDKGLTPTVATDYERWQPLHWVIEAPDVLVERGGFDAVVGNPPFQYGRDISSASGSDVREWLVQQLAHGVAGVADLCAYFFLRTAGLLRPSGQFGLIATNTIAQGDTRSVGLDQLLVSSTLTRAVQSMKWPTTSASLEVALVWLSRSKPGAAFRPVLSGSPVDAINSLLEPQGRVLGQPVKLAENSGLAFMGANINGIGFLMPPAEAERMIAQSEKNSEVLFPYLTGQDLNGSADLTATRWAVNFRDWDLSVVVRYRAPFEWIETNLRPHREKLVKKPRLQRLWWVYESRASKLYTAVHDREDAFAVSLVTKHLVPMRVSTNQVFSHKLGVFVLAQASDLAILSSEMHVLWARQFGSTLETRLNYSLTDVFGTFPRPPATPELQSAGRRLEETQRSIMSDRGLGLTDLYNLICNPALSNDDEVSRLRAVHVLVDEAVMASYGWSDIPLEHGFFTNRKLERWTVCPGAQVEILGRLLEENHRRAEAEVANGKATSKDRKTKAEPESQEALFS